MRRLNWGVVGLGFFGEKHCDVLSTLPQVTLHALCTRREARLQELAARYRVARVYTDYHQMLEDPELEVVSITTMADQHLEPTLAALNAGKHVFLEKPMASALKDCEEIVTAAQRASGRFMVGHICRFNPRYAMAKREIESGAIGRIVSIYARRNIPKVVSESVLGKIDPTLGDGVHDTDLMLWYLGEKIKSAYSASVDIRGLRNPDLAWTIFRFDSGALGVIENAWFLPDRTPYPIDERMEIIGTEGSLHVQESGPGLAVCDRAGWRYPDTTYWPILRGERQGALREELAYFANCVQQEVAPTLVSPLDALEAVRACLAAKESSASGKPVDL